MKVWPNWRSYVFAVIPVLLTDLFCTLMEAAGLFAPVIAQIPRIGIVIQPRLAPAVAGTNPG